MQSSTDNSLNTSSVGMSFPELRGSPESIKYPCLSDLKIDGECVALAVRGNPLQVKAVLVNKYGNAITQAPCIDWALKKIPLTNITLLCELYVGEGKNGDLYPLLTAKASNKAALQLYVHDIMDSKDTLLDRKEQLLEWGFPQHCKVINSLDEAKAELKRVNDLGFEGIVLKEFNGTFTGGPCRMAKMKYKDITSYQVFKIDPTLERMDIIVPNPNPLPAGPDIKTCGVKLCNKDKPSVTVGCWVDIEHQGVLNGGGLRHPVYKRLSNRQGEPNDGKTSSSNGPTTERRKVGFSGQV